MKITSARHGPQVDPCAWYATWLRERHQDGQPLTLQPATVADLIATLDRASGVQVWR